MPGETFQGPLAELNARQAILKDELRRDVEHLAATIGERNLNRYPALVKAADYIEAELADARYTPQRQKYLVRGMECSNVEVEIIGAKHPEEIVLIGAHYDSAPGTPGANDNASGVAALLALARRLAGSQPQRTVRLVAFTNEEPPYFQTPDMGSWVYARRCRKRQEKLVCMLSLETIGYYSDRPQSQHYPPPFGAFYPAEGNFIGVVGNVGSRQLVRQIVAAFRRHGEFPSEGGAIPGDVTGVGWSDHWSFWQEGYAAVMLTDTAPFRYPYYHSPLDTPDKLDFDHMARVVSGLEGVLGELAGLAIADEPLTLRAD
jgi:Zn-dependent M28 family amino/carboxypeptidase